MNDFAGVNDLAAFMGRDLSGADNARSRTMLSAASAAVRSYTSQWISFVRDDLATFTGENSREFVLPQRPVVDCTYAAIDGVEVDGWSLVESSVWLKSRYWGGPERSVEFVYSHGYEELPEVIKSATLIIASGYMSNPDGVVSESLDGYQTVFASGAETGINTGVQKMLAPYRARL